MFEDTKRAIQKNPLIKEGKTLKWPKEKGQR